MAENPTTEILVEVRALRELVSTLVNAQCGNRINTEEEKARVIAYMHKHKVYSISGLEQITPLSGPTLRRDPEIAKHCVRKRPRVPSELRSECERVDGMLERGEIEPADWADKTWLTVKQFQDWRDGRCQ